MLNSLFIQLFGRNVIDRLDAAGFESEAAIAEEGPDGLVRRAGIAPGLAARIVALAREIPDGNPGNQRPVRPVTPEPRLEPFPAPELQVEPSPAPELRLAPLPLPAPPAGRDPRYPILSTDLPIEASAAIESRTPGEEDATTGQASEASDPFVDAAGLVAWMGFALKAGPQGALVSSVADRILDKPRTSGRAKRRLDDEPALLQRKQPREADAPNRVTLEGTIWSFGHRPHPGSTQPPTARSKVPGAPGEARLPGKGEIGRESDRDNPIGVLHHRRRTYDGH